MKKKWTRRRFLATGLKGSIVMSSSAAAVGRPAPLSPPQVGAQAAGLGRMETDTLLAAIDEIIPAAEGMPAASAVGGVEYLDRLARQTPSIKSQLEGCLRTLDSVSRKRYGKAFTEIPSEDRIAALRAMEMQDAPKQFSTLRDYVYESYYTQPQIWKLIGYEFFPTNQAGPQMKPFDESVLAEVRKKPKFYRETT
jgi:hypothetical protein